MLGLCPQESKTMKFLLLGAGSYHLYLLQAKKSIDGETTPPTFNIESLNNAAAADRIIFPLSRSSIGQEVNNKASARLHDTGRAFPRTYSHYETTEYLEYLTTEYNCQRQC